MHIAFFTCEYPTQNNPAGGLANYLKKTSIELQRRGNKVTIFFLSASNRIWKDNKVEIVEIKTYGEFFQNFSQIPLLRIMARIIANIHNAWLLKINCTNYSKYNKIDIIQVPLLPHGGAMALFMLRKRPIPLIGRLSSDTISYQNANQDNLKSLSYRVITKLESIQTKRLNGIFGPCKRIAHIVKKREKIEVNVIKTPLELPQQTNNDDIIKKFSLHKPYFIYFGQLELVKGIDIAVEATKLLIQTTSKISVLFIGTPKTNSAAPWVEELKQMTLTYGSRVTLLPPQPKNKLYPLIQQSTAVLMPARLDNYPNACLEAQALGKIVIGTYDSCLEEMIVHGVTGLLAKNNNIQSFFKKMEYVLTMENRDREEMQYQILEQIKTIKKEDRVGKLLGYYTDIINQYKSKC